MDQARLDQHINIEIAKIRVQLARDAYAIAVLNTIKQQEIVDKLTLKKR